LDHLVEVFAAAAAIRELRLSQDPSVPPELREAASMADAAVVDLRDAVALALEAEQEGIRQPVDVVPDPGSPDDQALNEPPRPLWVAYRELEAALGDFLATVNALPVMAEESPAYHAAVERAGAALAAARWQPIAAADFAREGTPLRVLGTGAGPHDPPRTPEPSPTGGSPLAPRPLFDEEQPGPARPSPSDDEDVRRDRAQRHDEEVALLRGQEQAWQQALEVDEGRPGPDI
jgi:hypothetical protein